MVNIPPAHELLARARQQHRVRNSPAREDFCEFVRQVARDEHGDPLELDPLTRLTATTLDACHAAGRHCAVVMPPGSGKSTLARLKMLFEICRAPDLRTVISMGSAQDAAQAVALCRDIICSQPRVDVFPEIRYDYDYENKDRKKTTSEAQEQRRGFKMAEWYLRAEGQRKDPTMQACAVELKGEARRTDIALFDDIVGEKVARSAAETGKVENAFWNTWINGRMRNGGWAIYLQNLRNSKDLAHQLRLHPLFCSLWVGVTDDCEELFVKLWNPPDGLPVVEAPKDYGCEKVEDPEDGPAPAVEFRMPLPYRPATRPTGEVFNLWSPEEIRSMDTHSRRQLFHLKATDPEDLIMPAFGMRRRPGPTPAAILRVENGRDDIPVFSDLDRNRLWIALGFDWSSAKRKGKALTILAKDLNGGIICPVFHQKIAGPMREAVDLMNRLWGLGCRWNIGLLEDNAIQGELNQAVREYGQGQDWVHTLIDFTTTGEKWNAETGLPQLNVLFETGGMVWPSEMAARHRDWAEMEADFSDVTFDRAKMTPDSIMSYWFAWRGLQRGGAPVKASDFRVVKTSASGSRNYGGF